jgi:glutathione S-transferase
LRQFYKDFVAGFDRQRIADAITRTQHGFEVLNGVLDNGLPFLSGDQFGLADIAWLPNVHRMHLMGWPYEGLPALERWFTTMRLRPSYKEALLNWQDEPVANDFDEFTKKRHAEGTDVRSYLRAV